jgi:DNA-binding response OmpR family regulator
LPFFGRPALPNKSGGIKMNRLKVLLVEDDPAIIELLRLYLEKEGFDVFFSTNALEGIRLMEEVSPDILVLDIHLPDKSGFELARQFRNNSDSILIFLTGEKSKSTVLKGFEVGCDDYMTKPFDPLELVARLKANIRRSGIDTGECVQYGDVSINFRDKTVYKNGKPVTLFAKEKMLLFYLARHPNQVISTEQLFEAVWGIDSDAELKTVLVHISTLRKKIEENPKKPKLIQTERGFGYKLSVKN